MPARDFAERLSKREEARAAPISNPELYERMRLRTRLLHRLEDRFVGAGFVGDDAENGRFEKKGQAHSIRSLSGDEAVA